MKKRILSMFITLCMVLSIMPMAVFADNETAVTVTVKSADEFKKAIEDANGRSSETTIIKIGKKFNVPLSIFEEKIWIKSKVILDLNYYGFSIEQDINVDMAFYLQDNSELTIRDSTKYATGVLKFIGNGKKGFTAVGFTAKPNATLRLESGTVEGENLEYNRKMVDGRVYGVAGGFVRLDENSANFVMTGGTIQNFYGVHGGAVSLQYGKFIMEGGTIQNCYARNGGAIAVSYGKNAVLTIGGGKGTPVIKNNSAIGPGGGLAVSEQGCNVEIKGGLFEDNYSTGSEDAPVNLKNGAELFVDYGSEVKMSGGTIKNSGTGQYAISSAGKFTVTGSSIIDINSQHCTLSCSGTNNYFFDFDGGYAIIRGRYAAGDAFPISDTNGLRFGSSENSLGDIKQEFRNEDISDAQYIKITKKRTVTFKLAVNEPTTLSTQTVLQGDKIQKPADPPNRDGYVFNDIWAIYLGDGYRHWDFNNDVLTEDTTLYGRWSGYRVKVTFDANGYSMNGASEVSGEYGDKFKDLRGIPTINPASFMKFLGWYTEKSGGTKVDENTVLTEDMTVYAKCAPQYTVFICYIYENDEGQNVTLQTLNHLDENGRVPKPSVQPVHKVGYAFDDWYIGGVSYGSMTENYTKLKTVADLFKDHGTMEGAQGKIKLFARYVERTDYNVDFESDGNIIHKKENLKWNDKVLEGVAEPTREGYDFMGYKYGDKTVTADTTYADLAADDLVTNITLTAQWKDTQKPTGEIQIGTTKWYVFVDKLTFGQFYNDTQTVTINASDNSGKVNIGYYVTDEDLTQEQLSAVAFHDYNGSFELDENGRYVVYVKLADDSMNVTYLRSDGITIDKNSPVISGVQDGKTYCEAQTVTITDDDLHGVFVDNEPISLDENNSFVLSPKSVSQTISVYDKAGNTTEVTVTINNGHTPEEDDNDCSTPVYCKFCHAEVIAAKEHDFTGEWHNDEIGHWHECLNNGCAVKDTKVVHSGADDGDCTTKVVCECGYVITAANAEHTWSEWASDGNGTHTRRCTVNGCTAGVETENCSGADDGDCTTAVKCSVCGYIMTAANTEHAFGKWSSNNDGTHTRKCTVKGCTAGVETEKCADTDKDHNCDLCGKKLSEHTGGKATCKDKAKCEICGNEYEEIDPNSHADLRHVPAKEATSSAEGNIEYWYCGGCDKYYSDAAATNEIAKADTIIKRVSDDQKPPKTGSSSDFMLWIALFFVGGGILSVRAVFGKKRRS